MANKYYESGRDRAGKVRELFGAIAPRYDLINDLQSLGLHRLWKRRLVRLAAVGPGQRALDLCCGTGDVAYALARGGAEVVGMDFSEPMVARARQRNRSTPPPGEGRGEGPAPAPASPASGVSPVFLVGDVLHTPFPDSSFDVITIAYGLRNLSDWEEGLTEMWRLARPGGRLLVLDFGKPDNPAWRAIYFAYLRKVVPCFGRWFYGDAALYAYILESLRHYGAQSGVAQTMRRLGCAPVRIVNLLAGAMSINLGVKPR
jgi:ubiquinone/menaquinone biosynthesis C-methylase UbiE